MSSHNENHHQQHYHQSPIKSATSTVQHATNKVLHKLEGGMNKIGIGIEKAAKTVTKTSAKVVGATTNPRNEGLIKTKSKASKRIGLYDDSHHSSQDYDGDNNPQNQNNLQQLDGSNESNTTTSTLDDTNVNNIKFQAHDFHTRRASDAASNNFYKYYHLGRLVHKTEYCRIHVCRSFLTKRDRIVKIVRETCGHCHEFDVLKNTDHPNLPIMYELFQGKNFEFFIVMKYCEGGTLLNFLEAKRSRFVDGLQAGVQGATGMVTQGRNGVTGVIRGVGNDIFKDANNNNNNKQNNSNNNNHSTHGQKKHHHATNKKTTKATKGATKTATALAPTEGLALPGYGQKGDNQWDLALGKRGDASQSPVGRGGQAANHHHHHHPTGMGQREESRQTVQTQQRNGGRSPTRRGDRQRRRSPNNSPNKTNTNRRDDTSPDLIGNSSSDHNNNDGREATSNSPVGSRNNRLQQQQQHRKLQQQLQQQQQQYNSNNKRSPLCEEDAKLIMLQVMSCLRYCHENNIVHCDIKVGNIMFNYPKDYGSITLIDFDTSFLQEYQQERITYQRASGTGRDAAYLAPEVVQEEPCYGNKSDIWSAGVTLYKMLSNTLPFVYSEQDTEETIRKNIGTNPRVTFPESDFNGISEEAKDFIKFLLHPRPFERPCARQAVNHQWLASARDRMQEVLEDENSGAKTILQNLRKFNTADTKMKEAVCAFIASHLLTKEEIQPIDRVFKALDTQHDSKIRRYELKQAYYRVYNKLITDKELDKIMKRIDMNGNGTLSYAEFSMAAVNKKDLLSNSRLKKAFDLFDKQNKGYVTHDELRDAFRFVEMDINYLNKIIKQVDKDGDGKITFAEFVIMMTNTDLEK